MPNPTITAPANDADSGAADVTPAAWFDVWLGDFATEDEKELILTVPAGSIVRLRRDPTTYGAAAGIQIYDGATWNTSTVLLGDWEITPDTGGRLFIEGTSPTDGYLQVHVDAATGPIAVEPDTGGPRVDRVLAGPTFPGPATATPSTPTEGQLVNLTCAAPDHAVWSHGAPAGTLPPLPDLKAKWSEDPANITPAPSFASVLWTGVGIPTATFDAPAVGTSTALTFHVTAWYDLDGVGSSPTSGEAELEQSVVVTVEPAEQLMVVVVDRSGSMTGTLPGDIPDKWEAAVHAAHAWGDLFHALRPTGAHKLGFVTFHDSACGWGADASTSGDILLVDPASGSSASSLTALSAFDHTALDLGVPDSCTPIGDALHFALDALGAESVSGSPRYSVLLLTDGMENSGRRTIHRDLANGGVETFEDTLANDHSGLAPLAIYTVGVGQSVDESALNDLAALGASEGSYRLQSSVREILPGFADMLGTAIGAVRYDPAAGVGDAAPVAGAIYFTIPAGEDRGVILVPWANIGHDLHVTWRLQSDVTNVFLAPPGGAVDVTRRAFHGFATIDYKLLTGTGSAPAEAVHLRVQQVNQVDTPVAMNDADVICLVDPRTTADVRLSKPAYAEGEPIGFHVRVRTGGLPVKGATVLVEVDRPSESMGTFLSVHAQQFLKWRGKDPCKSAILTHAATTYGSPPDPASSHANMYQTLLRMTGQTALTQEPTAVVQLHDPDGTGDYRGEWPETLVEGTYRFKVTASGTTPDGDRFGQVHGVATYVGFVASAVLTQVFVVPYEQNRECVRITVVPRDAAGGYLGPFRGGQVGFHVAHGSLSEVEDHLDGSYSVIWCGKIGHDPGLVITIGGVTITGVVLWGPDGTIHPSNTPWGAVSEKYRAYWDLDDHNGGIVLFPLGEDRFHWRTKDPDEVRALVDLMRTEAPFYVNRKAGVLTTGVEWVGPGDDEGA